MVHGLWSLICITRSWNVIGSVVRWKLVFVLFLLVISSVCVWGSHAAVIVRANSAKKGNPYVEIQLRCRERDATDEVSRLLVNHERSNNKLYAMQSSRSAVDCHKF